MVLFSLAYPELYSAQDVIDKACAEDSSGYGILGNIVCACNLSKHAAKDLAIDFTVGLTHPYI